MTKSRQNLRRLPIQTDHQFHRKVLLIQHIGWAVMALLVLAALLGLFGNGPLSQATAGAPGDPIRLEYQRFARLHAPTSFRVLVDTKSDPENSLRIRISHDYLQNVQIQRITPEPSHTEVGPEGIDFVYQTRSRAFQGTLNFSIHPEHAGQLRGLVSLGEGPPLRFGQFVYP